MRLASHATAHHKYHPQLWVDVWRAQDPWLYANLDIPRSTRLTWRDRSPPEAIVGAELFDRGHAVLRRDLHRLQRRADVLAALVRLLVTLVRVRGADLRNHRLPDGRDKTRILHAVERAASIVGLAAALRVIALSTSRYHDWRGRAACLLDDQQSCPRTSPQRLSFQELRAAGAFLLSKAYRHFSVRALALHAQRLGQVFACPGTWYRLMREHGWHRPVERVYFRPEQGVRADAPNRIWHIDQTLLRLTDGTRVYIQAIIDNFSRCVLAWEVSLEYGGAYTVDLLRRAAGHLHLSEPPPVLWSDSGSENVNAVVQEVLSSRRFERVLAQIDIRFSNSMIERFFYSLKHRCLYLERLTSLDKLRELVGWFVEEHNRVMPHAAFHGQTPREMYLGTGAHIPDELRARHRDARRARLEHNQRASCGVCLPLRTSTAPDPPS